MQIFRGRFMVHSKHLREKKPNFAYSLTVQINWGNKWENIFKISFVKPDYINFASEPGHEIKDHLFHNQN